MGCMLVVVVGVACGDDMLDPGAQPSPFDVRELRVPVDPDDPSSQTIPLRYLWVNETGEMAPPVLVFQFGGPGSSAVEFLAFVSTFLPTWIFDRFALVGLDEIGVGESVPISCPGLGESEDEAYRHPFVSSTSDALVEVWEASMTSCRQRYRFSPLMHTERHAQDLERLRVELGVPKLNFMTYSYGPRIALTYAALFPDRVGKMVLDSPVDPRAGYLKQLALQARARDAAIARFLNWCEEDERRCAFSRDEFLSAVAELQSASPSSALNLLILFDELIFEQQWPAVAGRLGAVLAEPAQLASPEVRVAAPPAFIGTLCADWGIEDIEQIEAARTEFEDTLDATLPPSYFADVFNAAYACLFWPVQPSVIDWDEVFSTFGRDFDALLVNATGDFRAPGVFADDLAAALPTIPRLRVDEVSHTISLQGLNPCVDGAIRTFLEGGVLMGTTDCPKSN